MRREREGGGGGEREGERRSATYLVRKIEMRSTRGDAIGWIARRGIGEVVSFYVGEGGTRRRLGWVVGIVLAPSRGYSQVNVRIDLFFF